MIISTGRPGQRQLTAAATTHTLFSGVHTGAFLGMAPCGQRVELAVSDTLRLRDGRIIEHWGVLNIIPLLVNAGG